LFLPVHFGWNLQSPENPICYGFFFSKEADYTYKITKFKSALSEMCGPW